MISRLSTKAKDSKIFIGPSGRLLIVSLVTAGCSALSLLFSVSSVLYTQRLVNKEFPSLVQMNNGESAQIVFEDPDYISPTSIKAFVSNTLYHAMAQTSYGAGDAEVSMLNPNREKATPVPVKVGQENKPITQNAWLATEAMEPTFAQGFRSMLAGMTHPDVFSGKEEVLLDISRVKEPEPVDAENDEWAGKWTVDVIATLRVYRLSSGEVKAIPFNKRVTVKPIDSPTILSSDEYGELAVVLNQVQSQGLQITDMVDLKLGEVF